ncbi:molybdopterin converting factor subunit 1 [Paenibacillus sp. DMB20]|uniref:molybdopterin converting factor subunit 1 n=1 Tax=Paenibacillus sp. DMB20 TaxID=1642570 RepID=UPI000627E687|nr:molybdopterin converting factor subunit 1 [Paenibacillus sp. DMB20]KKO52151.1 molybdopterin converting factor [Paenibacillus sp. DMB20]
MIRIYYFAGLRDAAGKSEDTIDRPQWTVQELLDWAEAAYPAFSGKSILVAVNEEYAKREDVIRDGDTVALIPPVSGG